MSRRQREDSWTTIADLPADAQAAAAVQQRGHPFDDAVVMVWASALFDAASANAALEAFGVNGPPVPVAVVAAVGLEAVSRQRGLPARPGAEGEVHLSPFPI